MTRVPVWLSRRSLAFHWGKEPGFTYFVSISLLFPSHFNAFSLFEYLTLEIKCQIIKINSDCFFVICIEILNAFSTYRKMINFFFLATSRTTADRTLLYDKNVLSYSCSCLAIEMEREPYLEVPPQGIRNQNVCFHVMFSYSRKRNHFLALCGFSLIRYNTFSCYTSAFSALLCSSLIGSSQQQRKIKCAGLMK